MEQLSFYSAEAWAPRPGDLAGLLCGPGRLGRFAGGAARITVPAPQAWRRKALVKACAERGVPVKADRCEILGTGQLRTAFRADLAPLAAAWGAAKDKAVPGGFTPDGNTLRMWALAGGRWVDGGYLLATDPFAPHTQGPLVAALARCGLPAAPHPGDGGGPGLRITGRRRLARLLELVGPPGGPGCAEHWPAAARMRVVS